MDWWQLQKETIPLFSGEVTAQQQELLPGHWLLSSVIDVRSRLGFQPLRAINFGQLQHHPFKKAKQLYSQIFITSAAGDPAALSLT